MVETKAMAKSTKYKVTMEVTKLHGLPSSSDEQETAVFEVRCQRKRHGLIPLISGKKKSVSLSQKKRVECGGSVEWEQKEAARLENVSVYVSDSGSGVDRGTADNCDVSFTVRLGYRAQGQRNETKPEVIGTAAVNLVEWVREVIVKETILEEQIKQVPITLRNVNMTYNATLDVNLRVVEVPMIKGSKVTPSNRDEQSTTTTTTMHRQSSSCTEFVGSHERLDPKDKLRYSLRRSIGASTSYEVGGFWKRSFWQWKSSSRDLDVNNNYMGVGDENKSKKQKGLDDDPIGSWEKKEFICREVQTKLITKVFFASIDQRDESAGGESACAALAVVFAYAVLSKNLTEPTKQDLDKLIRDGSLEWQKMCDDVTLKDLFHDKHFDLETVMSAKVRPIIAADTFIGFFKPESFTSLSGAKSFDEMWNEITSNLQKDEERVYIVSWNDHFFVLKLSSDAFYIIDTLGERLFEGCNKAYILKFDDASEIFEKSENGNKEELIVTGKECCKEFISRFLAAIPLKEALERENMHREGESVETPHQKLQIEFHFTKLSEQRSSGLESEVIGCK